MEAREMMDSMSIEQQLQAAGLSAISEAKSLKIENQQDYERAAAFLLEIKRRAKQMRSSPARSSPAARSRTCRSPAAGPPARRKRPPSG